MLRQQKSGGNLSPAEIAYLRRCEHQARERMGTDREPQPSELRDILPLLIAHLFMRAGKGGR